MRRWSIFLTALVGVLLASATPAALLDGLNGYSGPQLESALRKVWRRVLILCLLGMGLALSVAPAHALIAGSGTTDNNGLISTNSNSTNFLASDSSVACSSSAGKLIIDTTAETLAWCASTGSTIKQAALGDDSGKATSINATSCSYVSTDASGVPACVIAPGAPEYAARVMTVGATTVAAYRAVQLDGTDDDEVVEATSTDLDFIGCSASGSSVLTGATVSVQTAGIARCASSSVVTGDLVKIGSTSGTLVTVTAATDKVFGRAITDTLSGSSYVELIGMGHGLIDSGDVSTNIALLPGRSGGQTLIGGTASGDDLTLQSTSNATKGTLFLDDAVELWPSMPDLAAGTVAMMSFASTTHDVTGGTFSVLKISPTTAHGNGASQLIRMNPTYTFGTGTTVPIIEALRVDGTWTSNAASDTFPSVSLFATSIVFDATAAGREPLNVMVLLGHGNTYRYSATSGTGSGGSVMVLDDNALWTTTGSGGQWTSGDAYTIRSRMNVTSTGTGIIIVPNRYGFSFADAALSGAGTETLTSQVAVDIAALSSATTNIGIRNADTTVFTPPTTVTVGAAFSLTATATTQKLDAAAARTSDTTTAIVDGVSDGQLFVIINVDTTPDIITIDDGGNTDLGGANCALNSGGTLTVMWVAVLSNWVKISCSPN